MNVSPGACASRGRRSSGSSTRARASLFVHHGHGVGAGRTRRRTSGASPTRSRSMTCCCGPSPSPAGPTVARPRRADAGIPTTGLADGVHQVSVTASGPTVTTTVSGRFRVDSKPPTAAVVAKPARSLSATVVMTLTASDLNGVASFRDGSGYATSARRSLRGTRSRWPAAPVSWFGPGRSAACQRELAMSPAVSAPGVLRDA